MKKLLALILALVMCIGLFAGCNNEPAATVAPTDAPTDAPTNAPVETDAPTMPPADTTNQEENANEEGWLKLGSLNEKFGYNNADYGGLVKNFIWSRLLMINGEEYFDEKDFLTETESGELTYDFSEGVWTHTYFEFEYPIIELIDKFKTVITDKLNEMNEETTVTEAVTSAS